MFTQGIGNVTVYTSVGKITYSYQLNFSIEVHRRDLKVTLHTRGGKVTFTYKTHPLTKKQSGSVTQPLPKDHWTETGKGKTGAERAEQAQKELEEEKKL